MNFYTRTKTKNRTKTCTSIIIIIVKLLRFSCLNLSCCSLRQTTTIKTPTNQ